MNPNLVDFWTMMLIQGGIGTIMTTIKNPASAAQLKDILGHLVDTICAVYGWQVSKP
jgi:hypothetical protein